MQMDLHISGVKQGVLLTKIHSLRQGISLTDEAVTCFDVLCNSIQVKGLQQRPQYLSGTNQIPLAIHALNGSIRYICEKSRMTGAINARQHGSV